MQKVWIAVEEVYHPKQIIEEVKCQQQNQRCKNYVSLPVSFFQRKKNCKYKKSLKDNSGVENYPDIQNSPLILDLVENQV
jgi:hypothetical protein